MGTETSEGQRHQAARYRACQREDWQRVRAIGASDGQESRRQDIYIVGATNAGKSTLINQLIRRFSDLHTELTVSRYPGTTLDIVRIPLVEGRAIVDTPGIVYPFRLTEIVDESTVNALLPDKAIKPVTYQLDAKQTLFFGSLARMDFVQGEHQSLLAMCEWAENPSNQNGQSRRFYRSTEEASCPA